MFDPDLHVKDPATGFIVDRKTGHPIGLVPPPIRTTKAAEYPAWIEPHESQVVRQRVDGAPDHVFTPGWPMCHVNRLNGAVTVLVNDEDEADRARAEMKQPEQVEPEAPVDAAMEHEVHADVEQAKRDEADAANRKFAAEQDQREAEEAKRRLADRAAFDAREREAAEQLAADQRARAAQLAKVRS